MCHHCGADKEVGYLNPTSISQSAINPVVNDRDALMVGKEMSEKKQLHATMVENARRAVGIYIDRRMYDWRDRSCIIAPYHFEYVSLSCYFLWS